jgi:hypothetical protein
VTCLLPVVLLAIALLVILALVLALNTADRERRSALKAYWEAQRAELRALDREDQWRRLVERRNEGTGTP